MPKPMLILRSDLTNPPRYYATKSYTVLDDKGHIRVTGKKWDVTEQIERLITRYGYYSPSHDPCIDLQSGTSEEDDA